MGQARRLDKMKMLELDVDQEAWIAVPLAAPWIVAYRLIAQGDAPVAAEIRVFPVARRAHPAGLTLKAPLEWDRAAKVPHGGVTSRLLRQVRIATHGRERRQIFEKVLRSLWQAVARGAASAGSAPAPSSPRTKRGRKGLSDLEYAQAAALYVKALDSGSSRPVLNVSKARRIPVPQARDLIHRARRREMLTNAGGYGRAGGFLTPKAKALLRTSALRHK